MEHHHSHHHNEINDFDEAVALLDYMARHNLQHTADLESVADRIREHGNDEAYDILCAAVDGYKKGNAAINEALLMLKGE